MTEVSTHTRAERAHRSSLGQDVTLIWVRDCGEDRAVVCVRDTRDAAYPEIATEPYYLDVYYHPFADRDFSTVDRGDSRLAE